MENQELMIRVQDVKKQYRLGQIGGGTLRGDLLRRKLQRGCWFGQPIETCWQRNVSDRIHPVARWNGVLECR